MISLSLSLYVTNPRPTPGVLRGRLQIDLTTAPQLTVTKLLSADSTMSMTTSSALKRDLESASTLSLTTTGDLAPLWTPVDTELWLDESTIVECDTYVSVWQDKSGNNNDVVQPAAALWFGHHWSELGKPLPDGYHYASDNNTVWLKD